MKKRIFLLLLPGFMLIAVGLFIKSYWLPAKYAIKEGDFENYKPYIIVQEAHYTGTGWVQVGDESGYFSSEAYLDVDLVNGSILPLMAMYNEDYLNKFLCTVEYVGKVEHAAFEEEIDSYYIVEWYPIYPVLRDTMLPSWMFPKGFMTNDEIK